MSPAAACCAARPSAAVSPPDSIPSRARPSADCLLGGGTVYLIGVQPSDGDALSAVQILDDGRVAISGVFLYWLDEKDMDGLRAIFDHLNTIYD